MKLTLYLALYLTSIVYSMDVRGQMVWNVVHSDIIGPTQFVFYSISCSGNNCTVGLTPVDFTSGDWVAGFYQTTDGGKTWFTQTLDIELPKGFPNKGFSKIQRIDSLNIVAISEKFILRTFDAGSTWIKINSPSQYPLFDIHFSDPLTGILAAGDSLFTTNDGGEHWLTAPFTSPYLWICHSYGNGKFRAVRRHTGEVFTTIDNFTTVDSTRPAFDSSEDTHWKSKIIDGCTFDEGETILGFGTSARPGPQFDSLPGYNLLVRTTNGGRSWEKPYIVFSGQLGGMRYTTALDRDTVIAFGNSRNKIFQSFDKGATWSMDSLVLDTAYFGINPQGLAMTGDGHLLGALSFSPSTPGSSILVRGKWAASSVYKLVAYKTRTYPNPATTRITITSPLTSQLIRVCDVIGREVALGTLLNDGISNIDLTNVPNGIYTISLEFQGIRVLVDKVIVMKK